MTELTRKQGSDLFGDFENLMNRFQRMFGRTGLGDNETLARADWVPSCNVSETPEAYHIEASIPGVDKKDVEVQVENGVLLLRGETRKEKEDKNKKYHRIERSYGSFLRTFTLPENVDAQNIKANFKDGLLIVDLPKTAQRNGKKVSIKVD